VRVPTTAAHRSGSREHGRQAARSKRIRTGRAGEETTQASYVCAGVAVTVQLSSREPSAITTGLLAWADTLIEITAEAWRGPRGDSVHLSVTGRLPGGTQVQVYSALSVTDLSLGAGLEPGPTTTVTLATLRHPATPSQAIEEVTL
jgi:hypothetical protein